MLCVEALLARLMAAYGPQHWWPAESPFEVIVGAILVQRTTWRNAELAIARLKLAGLVHPRKLARSDHAALAELVRPAGFNRAKAAYLKGIAEHIAANGGIDGMQDLRDEDLRETLVRLRGVGAETADAIMLYAFGRPVWVADAYSRRLLSRMSDSPWQESSERAYVVPLIETRAVTALNELHALVVEHGKRYCRMKPRCFDCVLRPHCAFGLSEERRVHGAS